MIFYAAGNFCFVVIKSVGFMMNCYSKAVSPKKTKLDQTKDNNDITNDDKEKGKDFSPKTWLEILPSPSGTILAAILANIMTDGLTVTQQNILGNFISSVGSLISYIAAREDLNQ